MPRKHNKSANATFASVVSPSTAAAASAGTVQVASACPTAAAESLAASLASQLQMDLADSTATPNMTENIDSLTSQVAQLLADAESPAANANLGQSASNNDLAFLFTPADAPNDGSDPALANDATTAVPTLTERVAVARRRLLDPTPEERDALAAELAARMSAGRGECIFELGMLDDDASVSLNLTSADFDQALATLNSIASQPPLFAAVTYIGEKSPTHSTAQTVEALLTPTTASANIPTATTTASAASVLAPSPAATPDPTNRCGYLLIRRVPAKVQDVMEVRVAVCGNVDAGKSSCLGVLTKNALDNGRGKARAALFRHKHELETGRTSSLGMECVGFDARGHQVGVAYNPATDAAARGAAGGDKEVQHDEEESDVPVAPTPIRKAGWDEIAQSASKVLTFIDLAGHEKYLKTTVYGLCGTAPDFAMLMVGANMGIIGMTKEHLGLNLALNVPVMIVVTKIDMCPANVLEATLKQLLKVLKSPGCRKIPMFVRNAEDVVRVSSTFVSDRICPIFLVSNVTGQGLPYLRQFLNLLPIMTKYAPDAPVEYQITESFSVPGVGTVVSGTILSGVVCVGDQLMLGPDTLGNFTLTQVKGIHIKRVAVPVASAGHTASFALKKIKRAQLRKGMVLVSPTPAPFASREFEAECLILFHSTTINTKYQAMLHCGNVRQTASLVDMDRGVLRSGDRARVRFRFLQYPEYIKPGARVLFREGRTKGIGKVTRVYAPGEVIEPFNKDDEKVRTASMADTQVAGGAAAETDAAESEPPSTPAKQPRNAGPPLTERSPRFKVKSASGNKVAPATPSTSASGGSSAAGTSAVAAGQHHVSKPRGYKA